ncbi:M20 family metallopeptidase [Haloarcula sp. Atlit-7R]|uniref:M20 family metallopeptidase n=1 Tax=Haloarcula sp. Atlit-7R TaxID=2282125 RepID=UPI000EF1469F|nr:M20/M25/M40 family metallo-hydrolase [Haloarcula sp. Atlit-7R]RLM97152.1 M20 family peptidase [Haloarcula sp. Atlit-7R]
MDTLPSLTRALVSIPSHDDEAAAGEYILTWLRDHTDAQVTRDDHGNVMACKGQGDDTLALVGHHDVVPPDDSQVDADGEYVVEQRDGRLYGRGTADMKGCVAAAMLAFRDADPAGELVFASFVGEEQGGVGCQAAIEDGFAPDYAVVGEGSTGYSAPGTTDVAVAHKGRRGSTLVAEGAAAHASEPDAGANAIYRATDAVDVVRDLDFPETTVLGHELSGSVAVTEIDGGSAWNVIPERCEVTVDERTVPGERAPLDRAEAVDGVTWRVDQDLPPMACGDADFADRVLDAAADAQDSTPEHVVKPHATDAGWLAQAGTDCVIVGAAEPGEAHTADESVSLAVLQRCREVYERVAESWPSE